MTDPNQPPVVPPSNNPPSVPPSSGARPAPVYGQPAAPQYGQAPAYGAPVYDAPAPQPYGAPAAGPDKYNVLAIVSLVASLLFFQLVGVITGHIALSQIKKTGEKGRGLAIAGLVLGYIGIVGGIIAGVIFFVIVSDPNFQDAVNNYPY